LRVALVVDNPARDLDGLVLVARALVAKGARALLVPMYQQGVDVPLLAPEVVVANFVRPANLDLLRGYRELGARVVVLDTEGGVLSSRGANAPTTWARRFHAAGHAALVDRYCFWGPTLAEAFAAERALPAEKIRVTGCPRFDFCFAPWRGALARPERDYVLVDTNFSAVNPRFARGGERAALVAAGWEPGYGHVSSAEEWDDYEWSWTGSLTAWALTEADEAGRASALQIACTHREEWLAGYRGQLGFVTVVLHDAR